MSLAWRQYRLERRMFWRNPSAAFFNFLLPLLFLAMFGAIFSGRQADLDVIVPGIAGMAVMATTFSAFAHNLTFLREAGILKRMRGTPLPTGAYVGAMAGSAITNTALGTLCRTVKLHHRKSAANVAETTAPTHSHRQARITIASSTFRTVLINIYSIPLPISACSSFTSRSCSSAVSVSIAASTALRVGASTS